MTNTTTPTTRCGNVTIFLSVRFYVKTIIENLFRSCKNVIQTINVNPFCDDYYIYDNVEIWKDFFHYCSDFTWNQFSESSENNIFAIFLALHFDNLANLSLQKVQIHKDKNSETFDNVLNWQIVRLDFGWAILISRKIWVIGISYNFQTVCVHITLIKKIFREINPFCNSIHIVELKYLVIHSKRHLGERKKNSDICYKEVIYFVKSIKIANKT